MFSAWSNPAHGALEIRDSENPWQCSQLEISLNSFRRSTMPQQKLILIIIVKGGKNKEKEENDEGKKKEIKENLQPPCLW